MSALIALSTGCSPKTSKPPRRPPRHDDALPTSSNWDRTSFDNASIYSAYDTDPSNPFTDPWKDNKKITTLPPTDGGWKAWSVLLAGFMLEAVIGGLPTASGIFQDHYLHNPPFEDDTRLIFVGVLAVSIPDLGAPLMTFLVERWPRYRIFMLWAGWPLILASLVSASFAPSTPLLIVTQGLLYGLGQLILFYPLLSFINEWWISRLGFAYGILDCAAGLTGVPMPFLISYLLTTYGQATTLRILSVAVAILTLPALLFVRGRLPKKSLPTHPHSPSYAFLKNPLFYIYASTTFLYALGWFPPSSWLPTYISDLSLSLFPSSPPTELDLEATGSFILALLSGFSVPSALILGHLSDKAHHIALPLLAFISAFTCSLSLLVFWGFAQTLWWLVPFAVIFAGWGGGWEVLWARMSVSVSLRSSPSPSPSPSQSPGKPDSTTDKDTARAAQTHTKKGKGGKVDNLPAYALLSFSRGMGNIVTGLAGSKLLALPQTQVIVPHRFAAGKYMPLILFASSSLMLASLVLLVWWFLPRSVTGRWDRSNPGRDGNGGRGGGGGEGKEGEAEGGRVVGFSGREGGAAAAGGGGERGDGKVVRSRRWGGVGGQLAPGRIETGWGEWEWKGKGKGKGTGSGRGKGGGGGEDSARWSVRGDGDVKDV